MPLSALQLYKAAQLEPADFGGEVVDPDATDAEQLAQALAYLESEGEAGASSILTSSFAEVSLPVRKLLGNYTSPLTNEGLSTLFGEILGPEVISLWDAAQTSFGRSELNKRVDSNSSSFDKDSDQDRIQGNQRLKSLLDFLTGWLAAQQNGGIAESEDVADRLYSQSVPVVSTW